MTSVLLNSTELRIYKMSIPFNENELFSVIGKQTKINEYEYLSDTPFWERGLEAYSKIDRFICEENHTRRFNIEKENKRLDEVTRESIRGQRSNDQDIELAVKNRTNRVYIHDADFSPAIIKNMDKIMAKVSKAKPDKNVQFELQQPPAWLTSKIKITQDERNMINSALMQKDYRQMILYSYETLNSSKDIDKAERDRIKYQNRLLITLINELPDMINLGYPDYSALFTLDFKPEAPKVAPSVPKAPPPPPAHNRSEVA